MQYIPEATVPAPLSALEDNVEDEDYDDGQNYHHSRPKPQYVLNLGQ
jgi:hypothetical protein